MSKATILLKFQMTFLKEKLCSSLHQLLSELLHSSNPWSNSRTLSYWIQLWFLLNQHLRRCVYYLWFNRISHPCCHIRQVQMIQTAVHVYSHLRNTCILHRGGRTGVLECAFDEFGNRGLWVLLVADHWDWKLIYCYGVPSDLSSCEYWNYSYFKLYCWHNFNIFGDLFDRSRQMVRT